MPADFLSEFMPPNSVPRGWIPNTWWTQFRFNLDPRISGCVSIDLWFLSKFAGADRVKEACRLPASVVNPTKFVCPELLGNMFDGCEPLPVTCLYAFAGFSSQGRDDVAIALIISGA